MFGSNKNCLARAYVAPVTNSGNLNRHSRRAKLAEQRRRQVVTDVGNEGEARISAHARDGKFCLDFAVASWRGVFELSPMAGEQHLRECLKAVEALQAEAAPEPRSARPTASCSPSQYKP